MAESPDLRAASEDVNDMAGGASSQPSIMPRDDPTSTSSSPYKPGIVERSRLRIQTPMLVLGSQYNESTSTIYETSVGDGDVHAVGSHESEAELRHYIANGLTIPYNSRNYDNNDTNHTRTKERMLYYADRGYKPQLLPPRVRASALFTLTQQGREALQTLLSPFYPNACPPRGVFVVVQAISPNTARISHFGGPHATPRQIMQPFTTDLLIGLIKSRNFVPDINVDTLEFVHPVHNQLERLWEDLGFDEWREGYKGASEGRIAGLPKRVLGQDDMKDMAEGEAASCGICLDGVELGKGVVELPCKHWFDQVCIETWLKRSNSCPLCREEVEHLYRLSVLAEDLRMSG